MSAEVAQLCPQQGRPLRPGSRFLGFLLLRLLCSVSATLPLPSLLFLSIMEHTCLLFLLLKKPQAQDSRL